VPIVDTDIVKRLSVAAAAGDTTAGTPAGSLGDQVSTTAITDATLSNLFDTVSAAEATAGFTDYRCFFVLNNHATLTATATTIEVLSQTALGGTYTIALDDIAVSAKGAGSAQAAAIAASTDVPSGVGAFGAGPLSIGDLAPGQVKGVWVRWTCSAATAAINPDGVVLRVSTETLP
jgi:hypothetical protein